MKFYQSNKGNIFPVEVQADGSIMLYDVKTGKPMEKQTERMVREFIGGAKEILARCKESPAQTMEEMHQWVEMVNDASRQEWNAEVELVKARKRIEMLRHRMKNYTARECKELGWTTVIRWDGEYIVNPKTGNIYFEKNDGEAYFERMKQEESADRVEELENAYAIYTEEADEDWMNEDIEQEEWDEKHGTTPDKKYISMQRVPIIN
ncbi:MAG: hypothetical protein ACOCOT_06140 [Prevotella sp.]